MTSRSATWPAAAAPSAGRRPKLARLLCRVGIMPMVGRLRAALHRDVRILAYHRVLPSAEPAGFSFDLDLVSASSEAFRQQLVLIRRRFTPMRFDELADCLDRGRPVPPRAVLITFDDGYDDNHRVAFPLLREAGLSAMFFVSSGHVASGRPYAYDWLVHMLCTTTESRLHAPELGMDCPLPVGTEALAERRRIAGAVLDRIKTLDAGGQQALVERLQREWRLPDAAGHPDCRPMRWEQLREMHAAGMEIGSHGVDHHMLAKLSPQAMRDEVAGSKRAIEVALGAPVIALSYPVGGRDAYNDAVMAAARESGYRIACSYLAGSERLRPASRFQMRRLPVERHVDADWFEGMLSLPELFCHRSRETGR